MIKRVLSWLVFALVVFGVVKAVQAFQNPWAMPSVSVIDKLPPASVGCGVKCND